MPIFGTGSRPRLWQFRSGIHRLSKPRLGNFAYLGGHRHRSDQSHQHSCNSKKSDANIAFHLQFPLSLTYRANDSVPDVIATARISSATHDYFSSILEFNCFGSSSRDSIPARRRSYADGFTDIRNKVGSMGS